MDNDRIAGRIRHMGAHQAAPSRDALKTLGSKRDEGVGLAQEKYGVIKEKAQAAVNNLSLKTDVAKQMVDDRLSQYDEKIQHAAEKLPNNVLQTITRYPWMTTIVVLGLGLIGGMWLKPCFKRYEYKYKYQQE